MGHPRNPATEQCLRDLLSFIYNIPCLSFTSRAPPMDETLTFLLADVSRLVRRAFEDRLSETTFTLAQARALIHVSRHEGVHQVELADFLEIQPITLGRLIDQLAQRELVERRPDPNDRRAYRIYLTAKAAPYLDSVQSVGAAVRAKAMRGLSRQDAACVMSAMKKMRTNLAADHKVCEQGPAS